MRLDQGEESCPMFENERIVSLSTLKLHREVALRTRLEKGRYAVVPATQKEGAVGEFFLSIYFSCEKRDISFRTRDDELETGEFIEEEEEIDPNAITAAAIQNVQSLVGYLTSV
jgi:hypothetical protein